jgi:hypothetical protein
MGRPPIGDKAMTRRSGSAVIGLCKRSTIAFSTPHGRDQKHRPMRREARGAHGRCLEDRKAAG